MAPGSLRQMACDPRTHVLLSFNHHIAAFDAGTDPPRDYLECSLEPIAALDGAINALSRKCRGRSEGRVMTMRSFVAAAGLWGHFGVFRRNPVL